MLNSVIGTARRNPALLIRMSIRPYSAFYAPLLSNRQNFEAWAESGSLDISVRANALWKQLLAEYEQPPLDPAIDEALVEYVEKRRIELLGKAN